MGTTYQTTCRECGHAFEYDDGGGFFFDKLRCETCGRSRAVPFDEVRVLYAQWIKGLPEPKANARFGRCADLIADPNLEPITWEEHRAGIETHAGACHCGGRFTFDAPPRCPRCQSTDLEEGRETILYD